MSSRKLVSEVEDLSRQGIGFMPENIEALGSLAISVSDAVDLAVQVSWYWFGVSKASHIAHVGTACPAHWCPCCRTTDFESSSTAVGCGKVPR